ncbi:MAG: alanine dehydrogenase [Nitrospirae bacterium]|nr:alanine dehydrogenase [Nitrospirota bacterium]
MIIGIPREIKEHEYRVAITPFGVRELAKEGHRVIVEKAAGLGSGFSDEEYLLAGAELTDRGSLFGNSELIVKVKEPVPGEYDLFRDGQALFTFLHLASNPELVKILLRKNISAFAYETLEANGCLPLLTPMSEIAGRMAPVVAAYYLQKIHGGLGLLLTGAEDVPPAQVVILGAGVVGMNALKVAYGMGAKVVVLNRGVEKLKRIDELYKGMVKTAPAEKEHIEAETLRADVLIGAVYITGAKTPKLISRALVSRMKKGSVIVDVSVDQGGCIETTRPATHSSPVYTVDGIIHYTVANMPGAYPRTSTLALTNKTLEYVEILVSSGIEKAVKENETLKTALNTYNGKITHKAVAEAMSALID